MSIYIYRTYDLRLRYNRTYWVLDVKKGHHLTVEFSVIIPMCRAILASLTDTYIPLRLSNATLRTDIFSPNIHNRFPPLTENAQCYILHSRCLFSMSAEINFCPTRNMFSIMYVAQDLLNYRISTTGQFRFHFTTFILNIEH